MGAKARPTITRARIRRIALWMTPWAWVVGTAIIALVDKQSVLRAAAVAAVGALGGLIVWAIYHAISGRNDGLAIFIMALTATVAPSRQMVHPLKDELIKGVMSSVILAVMSVVIGLFLRERREGKGQATISRSGMPRSSRRPEGDPYRCNASSIVGLDSRAWARC